MRRQRVRGATVAVALALMVPGLMAGRIATAAAPAGSPAKPDAKAPPAGRPPALTPETVTDDTVMAEVNGVKITFGDLSTVVREQIPNISGHGTISPARMRIRANQFLEQMITDQLILQDGQRLHITLDRKRVDAEMAKQRSQYPTEEKYQEALQQRRLTEQVFRQRMEQAVLIQQVINHEVTDKVTVTDEEMAAYYKDHKEKFIIPMRYRLRLLLVSVDPSASTEEWEAKRQQALDLRTRALKGEDFAALVKQYSGDAASRENGGDTGMIHHGQLRLTEVEHAVAPLKTGEITEPVRTIYGFYLARVEEKQPGRQQTFGELNKALFRSELLETKRRQLYDTWLTGLRSRATITRYSDTPVSP